MTETASTSETLSLISRNSISDLAYITGQLRGLLNRFVRDRELFSYLDQRQYSLKDLELLDAELKKLAAVFYREV